MQPDGHCASTGARFAHTRCKSRQSSAPVSLSCWPGALEDRRRPRASSASCFFANGLCCWGGLRTAAPSEPVVCNSPQLAAGGCLSRQRSAPRQASWRRPLFRPPPLPRPPPCCLHRHAPAHPQLQASVLFPVQAATVQFPQCTAGNSVHVVWRQVSPRSCDFNPAVVHCRLNE